MNRLSQTSVESGYLARFALMLIFNVLILMCVKGQTNPQNVPEEQTEEIDNLTIDFSDKKPESSGEVPQSVELFSTPSDKLFKRLPYFFDDIMVVFGVSNSGVYYTPNYESLAHVPGLKLGLESYFPVFPRAFLHFGVLGNRRGFEHASAGRTFNSLFIEMPLFLSYELPELEFMDWRFIAGTKFAYLMSTESLDSGAGHQEAEDLFHYDPESFNHLDWGFYVGMSFEKRNFYLRISSYTGVVKLVPTDQGMRAEFSLDLGFFPFRSLR